MKSAAQILRDARSLIDRPEKWCKGSGKVGEKRCIDMALWETTERKFHIYKPVHDLLLSTIRGCPRLFVFNDGHSTTHADVMQALDRAIALAEKDEGRESASDFATRKVREIVEGAGQITERSLG